MTWTNETDVSAYPWTRCWEKKTFDQSFVPKHEIFSFENCCLAKKEGQRQVVGTFHKFWGCVGNRNLQSVSKTFLYRKFFHYFAISYIENYFLHRKSFIIFPIYNLGQKAGDKWTKISKVGFSMECFTADFLRFFTKKCQNLAFGWTAGYSPSNPSISAIFWKFPNFLRS